MNQWLHRALSVLASILIPVIVLLNSLSWGSEPQPQLPDATEFVRKAFNHLRGLTSESIVEMTIHRPDWERQIRIKGWTKGESLSLFTLLSPPKDRGNGTLKKGNAMWMYNPKINRIIKLPPSMMSQAWMGSDFSNNDLAKSDTLVRDYHHRIIDSVNSNGIRTFRIQSTPLPDAPVIWGRLELTIREDFILVEEIFFDEDMKPVKIMTADSIRMMGGRLFPTRWIMKKTDAGDEYTRLDYQDITFGVTIQDSLFTQAGLKQVSQ